eukprot:TRINITY_DN3514_c0_g1_i1.p1 TRINITY_DN3514_c0_g1~~TRINITY_DN3514_c0_g1_i1.p1  ORF type:complete len:309 (-),score=104.03 TRINITY_DN3514_c0_g1_i1:185-1111(-)
MPSLVGSEMCIRDRYQRRVHGDITQTQRTSPMKSIYALAFLGLAAVLVFSRTLNVPSSSTFTFQFKTKETTLIVSTEGGNFTQKFSHATIVTTKNGLLFLTGLNVSDEVTNNVNNALHNLVNNSAYLAKSNHDQGLVLNVSEIMYDGFSSNIEADNNSTLWHFGLKKEGKGALILEFKFPPRRKPTVEQMGNIYVHLGLQDPNDKNVVSWEQQSITHANGSVTTITTYSNGTVISNTTNPATNQCESVKGFNLRDPCLLNFIVTRKSLRPLRNESLRQIYAHLLIFASLNANVFIHIHHLLCKGFSKS